MNTYGQVPNYTLLHVYGFVLADNPYDAVGATSVKCCSHCRSHSAGVCEQGDAQSSIPIGAGGGGRDEEEEEMEEVGAARVASR